MFADFRSKMARNTAQQVENVEIFSEFYLRLKSFGKIESLKNSKL